MAVINLQALVSRAPQTVGAGRDGKSAAYRQPRASLPLPMRASMPRRKRGHERFDHEAALAARTGRSAGCAGGLPHRLARNARGTGLIGWSRPTGKRSSTSFTQRNELPRPCAWASRFGA
jgi:hypothetical protein